MHEFFTSGDKVAVFGFYKGRVRATGKEFSSNWAKVWTMKDGLATARKLYFNFTPHRARRAIKFESSKVMLLYDSKVFDWLVGRVASLYEHISAIATCRPQVALGNP